MNQNETPTVRVLIFKERITVANGDKLGKLVVFSNEDKKVHILEGLHGYYITINQSITFVPYTNILSDSTSPIEADNRKPRKDVVFEERKSRVKDEGEESIDELDSNRTEFTKEDEDLKL
jgi:hypothetical protein